MIRQVLLEQVREAVHGGAGLAIASMVGEAYIVRFNKALA
jgi:hypothetical protein